MTCLLIEPVEELLLLAALRGRLRGLLGATPATARYDNHAFAVTEDDFVVFAAGNGLKILKAQFSDLLVHFNPLYLLLNILKGTVLKGSALRQMQ